MKIKKPKPYKKEMWVCDWCQTTYDTYYEAYNCCDE